MPKFKIDLKEFINPPEEPFNCMEVGSISIIVCSLNRYFKDKPKIDVRMWFKGEHDGKWRASKKGLSFDPELYYEFLDMCDTFGELMEKSDG